MREAAPETMREAMLKFGYDAYPEPDQRIHRYKLPDDKSGRKSGWYICFGDSGAFGDWRKPDKGKVKWSHRKAQYRTQKDHAEYQRMLELERRERRRLEVLRHSEAAIRARLIWTKSTPATDHPYLKRKQLQPHDIRQAGDALVIPMYRDREMRSIQRIFPTGRKRFLKDGDTSAAYYPIGQINGRLWIAEGFATSGSIHEATADAVACAFSGLNMAKVAKTFRKQYPDLDIRIAGDKGGEKYADEAMIACMGKSAQPVFDDGDDGSDWNDFLCLYGKDKTREALYGRV